MREPKRAICCVCLQGKKEMGEVLYRQIDLQMKMKSLFPNLSNTEFNGLLFPLLGLPSSLFLSFYLSFTHTLSFT